MENITREMSKSEKIKGLELETLQSKLSQVT